MSRRTNHTRPLLLAALLGLASTALLSTLIAAPRAHAQRFQTKKVPKLSWHEIAREAGIVVFTKEHRRISLPSFRAVGHVDASLFQVMAVLEDAESFPQWVERCAESRQLLRTSPTSGVLYSRTKVPWPVSDRDVVLDVKFDYDRDAGEVLSRFRAIEYPGVPEVDGVVRMPRLVGYVRLKAVSATRTKVTYEVNADPGGLIPGWLAKMVSREIPLKTIKALRRRVLEVGGRYRDQIAHWEATLGRPGNIQ